MGDFIDLIKQTSELAEEITRQSHVINKWAGELYLLFQKQHGFEARKPPRLEIGNFISNMHTLEKITSEFCANPVNMMTEKHFLIRKFFLSLGGQVQAIFEQTRKDSQLWLQNVLGPLKLQMSEHKAALGNAYRNTYASA
ncbi:MAG: hypothetical protein ABI475_07655 [Methylophilaceae bacterium]